VKGVEFIGLSYGWNGERFVNLWLARFSLMLFICNCIGIDVLITIGLIQYLSELLVQLQICSKL